MKQEEVHVAHQQLRLAMDMLKFPVDTNPGDMRPVTVNSDKSAAILPCFLEDVQPKITMESSNTEKIAELNRIERELLSP